MTKELNLTDHEFAAWLRERNAVDTFTSEGGSVMWRDNSGKAVAFAIYDNAKCTRKTYDLTS